MDSVDREDSVAHIDDACNTFNTKSVLKQHKLIHERLILFPCLICQKTFSQAEVVKKHLTEHTQETPHMCTICHKT